MPRRGGQRGRQPRLGIVDVYELDRQRQLILLRRDNVEHLLLVGGPNDVVIERNIQRGQQRDPSLRPEAMAEPLAEPGNAAFTSLETRAEAAFQPDFGTASEFAQTADFAMPIVLAPAVAVPGVAPAPVPPLDPMFLEATEPRPDRSSAAVVPGPRPELPGRRTLRRTAPPLISPRPDVASERARAEPAPAESEPTVPAVAIPPIPSAERRPVDPAILTDMARQLEAALARPASAVTPAPIAVAPAPAQAPDTPAPIDPVAAAMSAPIAQHPAGEADRAETTPPVAETPSPPPPEPLLPAAPEAEPSPPPASVAAGEAASSPPVDSAPKVGTPASAPVASAPKPPANPFSVEEIEAEFARLLGRPLDKRS